MARKKPLPIVTRPDYSAKQAAADQTAAAAAAKYKQDQQRPWMNPVPSANQAAVAGSRKKLGLPAATNPGVYLKPAGAKPLVVQPASKPKLKPPPRPRLGAPTPATTSTRPSVPVVPATTEKPVRPVESPAAPPAKVTTAAPKTRGKVKPTRAPAAAQQPSVQTQVQQIVNSVLNPQLASLNTQATQQNKAIQEGAAALIRELKGLPPVDYKGGADQVAQLAALSSAGLANANPNQQDQTLLQAINAPQAQHDQLQNQLANVFGGGAAALFQTGGRMPAQSIIEQGLAGQTFDRSLPGINALQAQQSLRSALAGQAQQRQQVIGQVPKLRMDIQNALADQSAKQQQLAIERQAFGLKAQNQQFSQAVTVQKLKTDTYKANLSRLSADRNYQLGLDRLGISEGNLRLRAAQLDAKAKTPAKKGGLTANMKVKLRGTAETLADNAYHGFSTVDKAGVETAHPPIDYQAAIREAFKEGIPLALILPSLDRYYNKGERGRPWLSFYERQGKKK